MKDDPVTSEEKLLRLIRKKDNSSGARPLADRGAVPDDPLETSPTSKKQMDLLAVSTRLLAVTAFMILVFVGNKYVRRESPVAPEEPFSIQVVEDVPVSGKQEAASIPSVDVRPFESYKQAMAERDVFQAPWEKPAEVASVPGVSASELTKQLKLVGILLDKDPKAIVEDLGTQQTFFVSPGERIGNAVVAEIRPDKVILTFGQEKVELVP